jgi:hypothetical protein
VNAPWSVKTEPANTVFHVKQHARINISFTNAEVAEDLVQHVFDVDAAG